MTESKIVATDRLRREDRWEVASWFRDQERKRLRTEGLTRREASEKAWELMIEKFPPLTPEELDWKEATFWRTAAHFPPQDYPCLNAPGEPEMTDLWWVLCTLRACAARWEKEDASGTREIWISMWQEASSTSARQLTTFAAAEPARFLDQVATKFQAVIGRVQQANEPNDAIYIRELQFHRDEVPRLKEVLATANTGAE